MDKTSMCFWWDKIKHLDIPMPKTIIVPFDDLTQKAYNALDEKNFIRESMLCKLRNVIENYPVFIRTDMSSAKHGWVNTCYIKNVDALAGNLFEILEFNLCCDILGLPATAFVVREYIQMAEVFKAFSDMPVNPERRYFIRDGAVLCHHSYWIQDAVEQAHHTKPLPEKWKDILAEANNQTDEEITLLIKYSGVIANVLEGFWSVDFCKALDGTWYFIDMAIGEKSWHPDDCPNAQ